MSGPAPGGPLLPFLGPEWLAALAAAAGNATLPPDLHLTLQQVVTGAPDAAVKPGDRGAPESDVRYHLVAEGGRLSVHEGQAADPDLTLTQSYELAAALSRGETNAQQALSAGRLKVSGNVELLVRHARALTTVADIYAELRRLTAY